VSCPSCGHDDHAPKPCVACALANTTCFTGIDIVGGDGDQAATGQIELATGFEKRPCCMCRHWENTEPAKLIEFIMSKGLKPNERGNFETPIAKDFKGRKSLEIDPRSSGYCRKDGFVTDQFATCENWSPTRTVAEYQNRMRRQ
jgi:hypothetical protein